MLSDAAESPRASREIMFCVCSNVMECGRLSLKNSSCRDVCVQMQRSRSPTLARPEWAHNEPHGNSYRPLMRRSRISRHKAAPRSPRSIQHWLNICRRASDDAQNLARRGLLLQGFGELYAYNPASSLDCAVLGIRVVWLQRSSSCWRSSAIVCACSATDVFTTGRRSFAFLFLEPFLVVLAIKQNRNERWSPANEGMTGSGSAVVTGSPAAELTFTSGG